MVLLSGDVSTTIADKHGLLSELFHHATKNELPAILPHLHLCYHDASSQPTLQSVVSDDVVKTVMVKVYVASQPASATMRFSIVLRVELRNDEQTASIPCIANGTTNLGESKRQFYTTWHRLQRIPIDPRHQLVLHCLHCTLLSLLAGSTLLPLPIWWHLHDVDSNSGMQLGAAC